MLNDKFKKKKFLVYFFSFLFFYNSIQIIDFATSKDSFQYGDWLINYSNGFVRRGLIGEIFLILSNILNIDLQIIYVFFLILILGIYYYKNYLLLIKFDLSFIFLILIFSPFLFFYTIYNHTAGIRKEIILLIFFVYLITDLLKNNNQSKINLYFFLYIILLLIHEATFFFIPFFVLILFIATQKKNLKNLLYKVIIFLIFSVLIEILLFYFKGDSSYVKIICDSFKESSYNNCINSGVVFEHFKNPNNNNLKSIITTIMTMYDLKGVFSFIFMFVVYFFPFIYFISSLVIIKTFKFKLFDFNKKNLFILIFCCYAFVFPLFFISSDWGRWLSIMFFLTFYLLLFLMLKKELIIKKNILFSNFFNIKSNLKKILIYLLIIFYSSFATPGVFYAKGVYERAINLNYLKIYNKLVTN